MEAASGLGAWWAWAQKYMPVGIGVSLFTYVVTWWHTRGVTEVQLQTAIAQLRLDVQSGALRLDKEELHREKGGDELKTSIRDLRIEIKEHASSMQAFGVMVTKMQGDQNVVNALTAQTLTSMLRKIEDMEEAHTEQRSQIVAHDKLVSEYTHVMHLVHETLNRFGNTAV